MRPIKKNQSGFTLVEIMIVVAIVGILAALAIYSVQKYMSNAKTAEAKNALDQIAKDASSAFARERMMGEVNGQGDSRGASNRLCASAANPVPASFDAVKGKTYQPSPEPKTDYNDGDQDTGWVCLKFSMDQPQSYQYAYSAEVDGTPPNFTAQAKGDLDADGKPSTFQLQGKVLNGVVNISPNFIEKDPGE